MLCIQELTPMRYVTFILQDFFQNLGQVPVLISVKNKTLHSLRFLAPDKKTCEKVNTFYDSNSGSKQIQDTVRFVMFFQMADRWISQAHSMLGEFSKCESAGLLRETMNLFVCIAPNKKSLLRPHDFKKGSSFRLHNGGKIETYTKAVTSLLILII